MPTDPSALHANLTPAQHTAAQQLLHRLTAQGVLQVHTDANHVSYYELTSIQNNTPWFLHLFMFVMGLLAGMFVTGLIALMLSSFIDNSENAIVVAGLLWIGSFILFRKANQASTTFLQGLGFAIAVAGQSFFFLASFNSSLDGFIAAVTLTMLVHLLIALLLPNLQFRLFALFIAWACLTFLCFYYDIEEVLAAFFALILLLCTLHKSVLLALFKPVWRSNIASLLTAIYYASAFMLMLMPLAYSLSQLEMAYWLWGISDRSVALVHHIILAQGLLLMACLYACYLLLARYQQRLNSKLGIIALAVCVLLAVVSMNVNGLLASWLLIMLAFANRQKLLLGIAFMALVGFVFWYYHQLDTTLIMKSASMLLVSAVLLVLRWLLLNLFSSHTKTRLDDSSLKSDYSFNVKDDH